KVLSADCPKLALVSSPLATIKCECADKPAAIGARWAWAFVEVRGRPIYWTLRPLSVRVDGSHARMTIMANDKMMAQVSERDGFIAALDQSGGSTPGALRLYGIADNAYSNDAEMFRLVHQMRVRIMTAPAFTDAKVIAAILFEGTMDGEVRGKPTPAFLWEERSVVPFVKIDKGLDLEKDGVSVMKVMPDIVSAPTRGDWIGVFGAQLSTGNELHAY